MQFLDNQLAAGKAAQESTAALGAKIEGQVMTHETVSIIQARATNRDRRASGSVGQIGRDTRWVRRDANPPVALANDRRSTCHKPGIAVRWKPGQVR
jgi:hypothetical protein